MEPEMRGERSKVKGRRRVKRPMRAREETVKRQRRWGGEGGGGGGLGGAGVGAGLGGRGHWRGDGWRNGNITHGTAPGNQRIAGRAPAVGAFRPGIGRRRFLFRVPAR